MFCFEVGVWLVLVASFAGGFRVWGFGWGLPCLGSFPNFSCFGIWLCFRLFGNYFVNLGCWGWFGDLVVGIIWFVDVFWFVAFGSCLFSGDSSWVCLVWCSGWVFFVFVFDCCFGLNVWFEGLRLFWFWLLCWCYAVVFVVGFGVVGLPWVCVVLFVVDFGINLCIWSDFDVSVFVIFCCFWDCWFWCCLVWLKLISVWVALLILAVCLFELVWVGFNVSVWVFLGVCYLLFCLSINLL